jgi:hypothetical protein
MPGLLRPSQEASCPGPGEAADVADLGDDDRGQYRADAGSQRLNGKLKAMREKEVNGNPSGIASTLCRTEDPAAVTSRGSLQAL